ncbi:molybdopterin-dependent oxidoreductase [uncultured Desulfovibrio sp.]|uniref:molybdopterin-dependent oxidoreductase n=1 Tax=uncultured Desulfovibrio sp. TaxID=167968 RepID=UPI00266D3FD4|nr:molybdopterin-dependent oxidoreductase [uncultured Desulfovibrio sp.]
MEVNHQIHSVCGMCSVRCPITVEERNNTIAMIYGNKQSPLKGALCARGVAGKALEEDAERPHGPLIRAGERGEGKWREVSWDEAFDYVARKVAAAQEKYGKETVLWSDREGPFTDLYRAFMRGLGSPNVCTHSPSCDLNTHHACKAVFGYGRGMMVYDYANCKHIVLQTRNIFEALNVGEARTVMRALRGGCKLSVIDIRHTVTASKADNVFVIRPGSDYAFNLAIINTLIAQGLYDKNYVAAHTTGFEELRAFVAPYTAAWAANECGVEAQAIENLAHMLAEAAPHVIWHPGWMTSRYSDSFQVSRTALVITALLGGFATPGGILPGRTPKDCGKPDLKKFTDLYTAPQSPRADGLGRDNKAFDTGKGMLHRAFRAINNPEGTPPVKIYFAWRHDPLQGFPDPDAMRKLFSGLDLLVSVTFSWSDTAWFADVVLPLSTYLARDSIIAGKKGLKPQFFVRRQAVRPKFNSKADWQIIGGLAQRLGLDALHFARVEDVWSYQLRGTGLKIADFDAKGFVSLTKEPLYADLETLKLPTASGKIELASTGYGAKAGLNMLQPYTAPTPPPPGAFRITFGRAAVHTQGHTVNNPLLLEQMPENTAWIHTERARAAGLVPGDRVRVLDATGVSMGEVGLKITDLIHPEALFVVHGFGHKLPCESRAFHKGVSDSICLRGGLAMEDEAGGGLSLQEHFVTLEKV